MELFIKKDILVLKSIKKIYILFYNLYIMTDNLFDPSNIPESSWMKFDKVWDLVKWTLVEVEKKAPEWNFPAQTVYVLTKASVWTSTIVDEKITAPKLEEVGEMNVGISKAFVNNKLKSAKVWDIIGFAFIKTIPAKTKGYADAKSIIPFNAWPDQEYLDSLWEATFDSANELFE